MTVEKININELPFSSDKELQEIAKEYGTPLFVHDERSYQQYGQDALNAPNAFGISVSYAMKANSHKAILRIFKEMGIGIDASSQYEVTRAIAAGIAPDCIQLTSQETISARTLKALLQAGVRYNATSLAQLKTFAEIEMSDKPSLSIRINPGLGSGHNNRTNTGGPSASFGIWRDYIPDVHDIAASHSLNITRLHIHVGSGSDWKIWQKAARMTLDVALELPDVKTVNMGGGFKIDRMNPQNSMNFEEAFIPVKEAFYEFAETTGRELLLEIEPGSYLAANSCLLLATVNDIVDTGDDGYRFLKLNTSMTELLRPMIYGDRHPIRLLGKEEKNMVPYVVVGMCCESGDIFTPKQGSPEEIDTAMLPLAKIGNFITIMGTGAYGLAMSAKNYNSRPLPAEVMILGDGTHHLITKAQEPEDIWARELDI